MQKFPSRIFSPRKNFFSKIFKQDYEEKATDHEKVVKAFDIVKKKVSEVNHRLKPLQDQIKKWKTELDKTQTTYKTKVEILLKILQKYLIEFFSIKTRLI